MLETHAARLTDDRVAGPAMELAARPVQRPGVAADQSVLRIDELSTPDHCRHARTRRRPHFDDTSTTTRRTDSLTPDTSPRVCHRARRSAAAASIRLQTFPRQVILRNFHVHNVCKYQLYRPSHTICRYTERLLMCACRPAVSIRGLFGKACSPKHELCYY